MTLNRTCAAHSVSSGPCRQAPLRDERYCFWHSPKHREEAKEARRLGGMRRKREGTLSGIYDFEGLGSTGEIRRLVEIAIVDTLSLDNSIARARTLGFLAQVAMNLLEKGELEERVASLEAALQHQPLPPPIFDAEFD